MGPMTYGKQEEQIFLGREIAQHRDYSEATAMDIDREVKGIVVGCYNRAREILEEHSSVLDAIAEALLEREVIDAAEVDILAKGGTLPAQVVPKAAKTEGEGESTVAKAADSPSPAGEGTEVLPEPGKQPA
jgi:cell division protease FtsH